MKPARPNLRKVHPLDRFESEMVAMPTAADDGNAIVGVGYGLLFSSPFWLLAGILAWWFW